MIANFIKQLPQSIDLKEKEHIQFALNWAVSGLPMYRIEEPATPPIHLVAYCVLLDPVQKKIWLGQHLKSGLWLPPGGHADPNENPKETACREILEELKVEPDLLIEHPFFLAVTKISENHTDVSFWYLMRGDSSQILKPDPVEFSDSCWFAIDEIPYASTDRHMRRFVNKLISNSLVF